MTDNNEDRVRERAYALWELDGRPEGRHEEYWSRASQEVHGLEDLPPAANEKGAENTKVPGDPKAPRT